MSAVGVETPILEPLLMWQLLVGAAPEALLVVVVKKLHMVVVASLASLVEKGVQCRVVLTI